MEIIEIIFLAALWFTGVGLLIALPLCNADKDDDPS
jgi:hypothetical protein